MKTKLEIIDWCKKSTTTQIRRHLPRMVDAYNRHNNTKLHYAYHEDGRYTWSCGWSELDYYPDWFDKNKHKITKLFETTWLIGKKKPAVAFRKAATYTAECAIFLFEIYHMKEDAK